MKTLTQLIQKNKFDWVNDNITKGNFPVENIRSSEYKLYHFDSYISSDNAIKEMEKEGYSPANIYELLSWMEWNGTDWVICLGSSCKVSGYVFVPFLDSGRSGRRLRLGWRRDVWSADCRFLAVRTSPLESKETKLGISETLTLPKQLIINGVLYIKQ